MSFLSGPKPPPPPRPTPVTPRISDTELKAKDESAKTRKRVGIEDQILSLGRTGSGGGTDRQVRYSSLLGRSGS